MTDKYFYQTKYNWKKFTYSLKGRVDEKSNKLGTDKELVWDFKTVQSTYNC